MRSPVSDLYEFGGCRLDVAQRRFTRDEQAIPLAPKSFELLWLLVQNPDRPFSKQELMTALWADTFVEEANLSFQISVLRKALGEDGARWIETMPKHGYRFTAGVKVIPSPRRRLSPRLPPRSAAASAKSCGSQRSLPRWCWPLHIWCSPADWVPERSAGPSSPAVPLTTYEGMQGAPSLSPDGSQVAFAWDGRTADNYDIWVKLVGPGEPIQLTTDPAPDLAPAWSPDARFIAFQRRTGTSGADVIIIPALGGAERRVAAVDVSPGDTSGRFSPIILTSLSWTPDSKWIAVGGGRSPDEARGIWLISVDPPEIRRITEATGNAVGDWLPAISHDGRHVAFVRQITRAASGVYVLPLSSAFAAAGAPVRVTPETANISGPRVDPGRQRPGLLLGKPRHAAHSAASSPGWAQTIRRWRSAGAPAIW